MPEFSGIDIIRHLDDHEKLRDNTILFLTVASIDDLELQKWLDKGVKLRLNKPLEFNDLFERLMEVEMK